MSSLQLVQATFFIFYKWCVLLKAELMLFVTLSSFQECAEEACCEGEDILWLISQHLPGQTLQDGTETLGHSEVIV